VGAALSHPSDKVVSLGTPVSHPSNKLELLGTPVCAVFAGCTNGNVCKSRLNLQRAFVSSNSSDDTDDSDHALFEKPAKGAALIFWVS